MFRPGETVSVTYDSDFSTAIGIIIRADAEIKGISGWKEVPESNKELCYARLFTWFDIEDWSNERVKRIVDAKFQKAFTRWRNTLHSAYDKLVEEGINPRETCPRTDVLMEKWLAACDFIENEKYQKRSRINSQNRGKMPFSHTSGRTPILYRYREMDEPSEIELFKETRVSKKRGGEFVNEYAQSLYEDMVKLKRQPLDKDEEPVSEAEIVKSKLGHKSGYVKGMGHELHVLRGSSSNVVAGTNMKETLTELENAKVKIRDLSDAYEEQNKNLENQKIALEACEEKYSDEINTLKAQVAMMQKFMQKMSGIPSDLFHD